MPVGNRHRPSDLGTRRGSLLHLIMSVAMVVMAWPWGATLPTIGPLVFFLLATVWFVVLGFTDVGHASSTVTTR